MQQFELDSYKSGLIEDEELEYINKQQGITLDVLDNYIFSMARDLTSEDIDRLTKN
jgi:hypothetical protein